MNQDEFAASDRLHTLSTTKHYKRNPCCCGNIPNYSITWRFWRTDDVQNELSVIDEYTFEGRQIKFRIFDLEARLLWAFFEAQ